MTALEPTTLPDTLWPPIFKLRPGAALSDNDAFFTFCQDNTPWEFERGPQGELIIKMPTGGKSGARSLRLSMLLGIWALQEGSGSAFDSSTGFTFSNGAIRSPDVSWVKKEKLAELTEEQKETFLPVVPDFVAELRSKTDRLTDLKKKLTEYIAVGVRLGVLLDAEKRIVYVYRPGSPVQTLTDPTTVDCAPELPGFLLDCAAIFDTTI
jgi:Uma2 family endonuclease